MAERKRAVAYLRVSGPSQVKEGKDGFPRQRRAVTAYAKKARLELVEEFREEAIGGDTPLGERPALGELLLRVGANGVRIVLVENAQRLARDVIEGELILRELRRIGVKVLTSEGVDLSLGDKKNPTAKLIRQVLNAVSEFEKDTITLKLRVARERKRKKTGRCEGPKPFGFFEGEPETLTRMRELRKKRRGQKQLSYGKIADILNQEGRASRSGNPWNRGSIHKILKTA